MTTSFYISGVQTLVCRTVTRRACGKVKIIHTLSLTPYLGEEGEGHRRGRGEREERERHEWVREGRRRKEMKEGRRRQRGMETNICEKYTCLHLNVL